MKATWGYCISALLLMLVCVFFFGGTVNIADGTVQFCTMVKKMGLWIYDCE